MTATGSLSLTGVVDRSLATAFIRVRVFPRTLAGAAYKQAATYDG
jgi:hypothetical protein